MRTKGNGICVICQKPATNTETGKLCSNPECKSALCAKNGRVWRQQHDAGYVVRAARGNRGRG
jgi:hypothetical protein